VLGLAFVRYYSHISALLLKRVLPYSVLYGFSLAYLIAPGTFDSVHVIEFVAGLPDAAKYAGKVILAAPFAFHSWNGLRHLSWDMGKRTSCEPLFSF
jgi:succinate dehydrogenase (ubiquinone) cytochrome b560 subunit